jgi:hypothetical protein
MAHDPRVDEVVGRAAVEEGEVAMVMDVDAELHRVLSADAGNGMEGDDRLPIPISKGCLGAFILRSLVGQVVGDLQVEEPRTLVWQNRLNYSGSSALVIAI